MCVRRSNSSQCGIYADSLHQPHLYGYSITGNSCNNTHKGISGTFGLLVKSDEVMGCVLKSKKTLLRDTYVRMQ